jgi:hypothetical protein
VAAVSDYPTRLETAETAVPDYPTRLETAETAVSDYPTRLETVETALRLPTRLETAEWAVSDYRHDWRRLQRLSAHVLALNHLLGRLCDDSGGHYWIWDLGFGIGCGVTTL